ncbi:MAG: hypothetical protein AAGI91_17505 [Bacteroidota bacterium]
MARDRAVTYLRGLAPRDAPLALGPGVVVTDHATYRGRLVRRLLSGDPGAYVSALAAARRYRNALGDPPDDASG